MDADTVVCRISRKLILECIHGFLGKSAFKIRRSSALWTRFRVPPPHSVRLGLFLGQILLLLCTNASHNEQHTHGCAAGFHHCGSGTKWKIKCRVNKRIKSLTGANPVRNIKQVKIKFIKPPRLNTASRRVKQFFQFQFWEWLLLMLSFSFFFFLPEEKVDNNLQITDAPS